MAKPASLTEAQRAGSLRRSAEAPCASACKKATDPTSSPPGSLPEASSLLRGTGHAAEGTLGAEGWWRHMDHSQMNEQPLQTPKPAETKGFVPQFGITGQNRSLWADEAPATPAAPPAEATPAPADPAQPGSAVTLPATAPETAIPAAAVSDVHVQDTTIQNAGTTGWWAHMDNSILNKPAEAAPLAPGEVRKGERVMGGGFTPQFGVAGGNHYGSIFDQPQDAKPAGDDSDWSSFTSAPRA
ncbi:hypothetical protein Agub_g670 [Astrephomene gubernaculifera]|uniref:Uncharacterized protein n=1 Tax=Astrephomene gubernaculifera TaxID=47775 RepID=A0AAD3HGV7_9CHLO|nr:hypothetical protein Agub_g670 [Astrephomene gubernaculifera]